MVRTDGLLCPVDIEEVGVQDGLDNTRNDSVWIIKLGHFGDVSVNPVRDVQRPVCAERKEIMSSNRFRFASSLQHKELGKDSNRFKPDGKRPEDLQAY